MNADRLLAHFNTLVDTPGAVPRLRRFILDLAVRGKLAPQDPTDEPVSELLKRNETEQAKLAEIGRLRRRPPLSPADRDLPHDIPATWSWVRLGQIVSFSTGRTPRRNEPSYWNSGDYAWVSIRDMSDGSVLTSTKETVTQKARDEIFRIEPEQVGTILMSFKLTIGKMTRLGIPAYHNEAIISIRTHVPEIDPYLFAVLPVFARQGNTKDAIKGATLNRTSLSNILVPLPALAEQHRIVAKVDELMTLCDRLEEAQQEREAARDRFATTSLARLGSPDPDLSTFHADAAFAIENFDRITARSDQVAALRRTVLDLAVRGRLVPQDPTDEPASKLLERITKQRARMIDQGVIRKPRESLDRERLAGPFDIPSSWRWVRLRTVGAIVGGGTPAASDANNFADPGAGFPWLTPADLGRQRTLFIARGARDLTEQGLQGSSATPMPARSVLFTSRAPVGYVAIALNPVSTNQGFKSIVPYIDECSRFIAFVLMAFAPEIDANAPGTTFREVSGKIISQHPFPLPPLAEQQRIVAKADELMTLCDRLEERLVTTEDACHGLLDAVLNDAIESNTCGHAMAATASVAVA